VNRRSFIGGLISIPPLIFVPKLITPVWGTARKPYLIDVYDPPPITSTCLAEFLEYQARIIGELYRLNTSELNFKYYS
jgi:hypothetical protein